MYFTRLLLLVKVELYLNDFVSGMWGECQHIIFDRSVRLSNNIPERLLYHQCMMKSAVVCKFANPFFTLRLVLKQIYCGSYGLTIHL